MSIATSQAYAPRPLDVDDGLTPWVPEVADCSLYPPLGDLSTLLDIASREADCPAFFLASTLLETLVEHMSGASLPEPTPSQSQRGQVLSLDALVPAEEGVPVAVRQPEIFDLTARQCALPCDLGLLHSLERSFGFSSLLGPPAGLARPERFEHWVSQGQIGRSPAPDEIVVLTTDGSFDSVLDKAGWAVTVSLVSAQDLLLPGQFVGCIAGSTSDLQHAFAEGFPTNSAYLAEVAGLFGRLYWRSVCLGSSLSCFGQII